MSVVGRPELWKPWANEPESFERAILADLEEASVGILPTSCASLLRGSSVATSSSTRTVLDFKEELDLQKKRLRGLELTLRGWDSNPQPTD